MTASVDEEAAGAGLGVAAVPAHRHVASPSDPPPAAGTTAQPDPPLLMEPSLGGVLRQQFQLDRADRLTDILFGVAVARGVIEYEPAARRVDTRADFMSEQLDTLSQRAHAKGEPLWSALVVSTRNGGRPKSGFFGLARRLRPEYADLADEEVWTMERDRCYAFASA
jgi:hypothetical protein